MATFGSEPVAAYGSGGGSFTTSLRQGGGGSGGNVSPSVNTNMGVVTFDFADPVGSIAESAGNIGDMAGGLVGGVLGAVGSLGIPGVGNIGQIPEAIGNGIGAVGAISLGGTLPTNPTLGGTLGGGGQANVGAIPGAMMDVIGLPGKALQRSVAGGRAQAAVTGQSDLLGYLLEGGATNVLNSMGLGGLTGTAAPLDRARDFLTGASSLPQDIQDALDAGEMTVDEAGDELVARGAGFSSNSAVNLASEIVYDPLNLIGGMVGKGGRLAQQAGIAVEAAGDVDAVNRVVGKTYNAATHGLTRAQQTFMTKIAGPATAGVAQAIGPGAVRDTIHAIDNALGPDLGGRFEDALATGNAHYVHSTAANSIASAARKGLSKAAETFKTPDEVSRLVSEEVTARRGIAPKQLVRDTENYARRTLPTVIDPDETIRKVAAITGTTEDDARRALGPLASDLGTQQTVHLAYWGKIADDLAQAKAAVGTSDDLPVERLTPIAPDTLTDQRARDVFKITQDADGKTAVGASDDEIRAAVDTFAELAKYRGDAYDQAKVVALVKRMWEGDYLIRTLEPATAARPNAIPSALGDVRAAMNEFGYELGFGPESGWRTLTDDAGEVIEQSPFLVVSSTKDPLTVRNKFGRFMDDLFRGITQDRIIYEARARMAQRVAPLGVNEKETGAIFQRILSMSREQRVAPRGLVFGGERATALPVAAAAEGALAKTVTLNLNRFDQAFLDVIGPDRFVKLIQSHDPTTLAMQAFKGNWSTVGLTQTISGAAKAAPKLGRGIAAVAEFLYPAMKFKYNAMFQAQELVESPFLNLLRGIDGTVDPDLADTYQSLIGDLDEFRWLSGAEYTLNTASGESIKRAYGDSAAAKLAANVGNVQAIKQRAQVAQIITEHPEEFQQAIVRVNPRLWKIMEDAYGTSDPAAITAAFIKERMASTGSLTDALRVMDEAKPAYDEALTAMYHGTTEQGARSIERGGFSSDFFGARDRGPLAEPDYHGVYLTRDKQKATDYYATTADRPTNDVLGGGPVLRVGVDSKRFVPREVWRKLKTDAQINLMDDNGDLAHVGGNNGQAVLDEQVRLAREAGYVGVEFRNGTEVLIFDPADAKVLGREGAAAAAPAARESDYAMETIWNAFVESARARSDVAFRTHYFSASRSFFERTINHPYLGLYPASYMFGKVLPEFARFLLLRPFGKRAPLVGQAALMKVQEAYLAQLAQDPELAEWMQENKDAIYLANMLLPASPYNIDSRLPAYARRISQSAQKGNIEDGADLANTVSGQVTDSLSYALGAPVNAVDTFGRAVIDLAEMVPSQLGRLDEALTNAAAMYDGMNGVPSR